MDKDEARAYYAGHSNPNRMIELQNIVTQGWLAVVHETVERMKTLTLREHDAFVFASGMEFDQKSEDANRYVFETILRKNNMAYGDFKFGPGDQAEVDGIVRIGPEEAYHGDNPNIKRSVEHRLEKLRLSEEKDVGYVPTSPLLYKALDIILEYDWILRWDPYEYSRQFGAAAQLRGGLEVATDHPIQNLLDSFCDRPVIFCFTLIILFLVIGAALFH